MKKDGMNNYQLGCKPSVTHPLYRTASIIHDYFSPANIELFPERLVIVGFTAADGCVHMKKSKKQIYPMLIYNLAQKDQVVLDLINMEIASGQRHISPHKSTRSLSLYFPSRQICSDLAVFGIVPRKTNIFRLPHFQEKHHMAYFMRGYFYGDGCVGHDGRRPYFHMVGNTSFALDVKNWCIANKICEHVCVSPLKNNPGFSQFVFQGKHADSFSSFIFQNDKMLLLPRKHLIANQQPKTT